MLNSLLLYSNSMNIFLKEIRNFSRDNWWLYIIFFICISLIWYTNTGNIFEISVVFFLHFLWDIFMMMMGEYYANWEKRKGSISQILSVIVFTFIWIYAFIFNGKIILFYCWEYLFQLYRWLCGRPTYATKPPQIQLSPKSKIKCIICQEQRISRPQNKL